MDVYFFHRNKFHLFLSNFYEKLNKHSYSGYLFGIRFDIFDGHLARDNGCCSCKVTDRVQGRRVIEYEIYCLMLVCL